MIRLLRSVLVALALLVTGSALVPTSASASVSAPSSEAKSAPLVAQTNAWEWGGKIFLPTSMR